MNYLYKIAFTFLSLSFLLASMPDSLRQDSLSILSDSVVLAEPDTLPIKKELIFPQVDNNAFQIGEKLYFKLRYGFIRAGTAVMEVKREQILDMRPVYHIQTTARSASGFNWIFNVDDEVNSYMDKWGLFSWKFEKKLREGGYKVDILVDYNPYNEVAHVDFTRYHDDMKVRKKESYDVSSPSFTFDILAAFYYIRNQELKVGQSLFLTTHDEKKNI
jgi:hypothetical protein